MKIILSRKGFDSGYGCYPSFIMPNNDLISLPIPSLKDDISYSYLKYETNDILAMMKLIKPYLILNNQKIGLNENSKCHLDPDLNEKEYKRVEGWKGCFGQSGTAEKVLENNLVKPGDIFLFFGWFNDLDNDNGSLKFVKGNDRHVIFGYLQVGEIIDPVKDNIPNWLKYHSHAQNRRILSNELNKIYVARETCTFNSQLKGYRIFKYTKDLDLSKKGMSRTCWNLPDIFRNVKITYHSESSWHKDYFKSACRGQEFVIEENEKVEKWATNLINSHAFNEKVNKC